VVPEDFIELPGESDEQVISRLPSPGKRPAFTYSQYGSFASGSGTSSLVTGCAMRGVGSGRSRSGRRTFLRRDSYWHLIGAAAVLESFHNGIRGMRGSPSLWPRYVGWLPAHQSNPILALQPQHGQPAHRTS
jgi:hypothetical protein